MNRLLVVLDSILHCVSEILSSILGCICDILSSVRNLLSGILGSFLNSLGCLLSAFLSLVTANTAVLAEAVVIIELICVIAASLILTLFRQNISSSAGSSGSHQCKYG